MIFETISDNCLSPKKWLGRYMATQCTCQLVTRITGFVLFSSELALTINEGD